MVPIVHRPRGGSLRFARLVKALCCRGGSRTSLIRGGFVCFTRRLEERVRISVRRITSSRHSFHQVTRGAKVSTRRVNAFIHRIHPIVCNNHIVSTRRVGLCVSGVDRVVGRVWEEGL